MRTSWHSDPEQEPAGSEVLVHPAAETGCGGSLWHRLWTTPLGDLLRGRMTCRLDVRAIVAASGLPELVRARVLDTVKRTRLSRREKAGIAGELVGHFADGLEAGVSADEILSGFGDARATAKLMRRAKLRCRAWPRRAMRRIGQALGVLVVVYAVAAIYFAAGRPQVSVDYLARMNAAALAVPEEDRAWPVYREALLALDREQATKIAALKGLEPGVEGWDDAVRFIADHGPALATARRAAAMESLGFVFSTSIAAEDRDLWPERYGQEQTAFEPFGDQLTVAPDTFVVWVQMPHMMELRRLHQLLATDAAIAAERSDAGRVNANLAAMLGMAGQLGADGTVIGQLIRAVMFRETIDLTGDLLRRRPELLTQAHLRRLAHAFAAEDTLPRMSLSGERLFFEDTLQRIYTDDGRGDGHLAPGALGLMRVLTDVTQATSGSAGDGGRGVPGTLFDGPAAGIAMGPLANAAVASRKEMEAVYDRVMDRYEARFATPYWEARRSADVGDEFRSSRNLRQQIRYLFVSTMVPGFDSVYRVQEDSFARRDGILVAIALVVHRGRHGDWPATLDELTPDLLPSVPRDRFTGEPLRYRVDGGEVVVYSVGQDLDDDGGVLSEAVPDQDPEQTPRECFRTINTRAGVRSYETPDGDWILWHSAPLAEILEGGAES